MLPNCLDDIINDLDLSGNNKVIIKCRYNELYNNYSNLSKWYGFYFNYGRMFISFGSISIPALLSIDYLSDKNTLFWITWGISLAVSIINAYIALLKIDKKYYSTNATLEQLNSELWQFVGLCGKYSGFYTKEVPNHSNQFKYFLNNIEKLQMRYIEEQYVKVSDESHLNKNEMTSTFVPPSIYKNQLQQGNQISPSRLPQKSQINTNENTIHESDFTNIVLPQT